MHRNRVWMTLGWVKRGNITRCKSSGYAPGNADKRMGADTL